MQYIASMQYVPSHPIANVKEYRDDGSVVEIVVWLLDAPVPPCTHPYKYRLYYGAIGLSRVRYDNERGKGDHKHMGAAEIPYRFVSLDNLLEDFQRDVTNWRG